VKHLVVIWYTTVNYNVPEFGYHISRSLCITVYYSICQYITVYYSIIQYITVYSTAHYNVSSQTHVPPASFLAVTLSASLLPTCRSCLPSIDPTWIALQDKKEREKESKWRGGGCEGDRGGHQFYPYLFISQKDIWPSRVATASSNPSGLKASVITAERNWEEVPLLHSKVHLENNIGSRVTHHRWYGRGSRCFPFVQTRPTVSPSYPRSQTQGGLARDRRQHCSPDPRGQSTTVGKNREIILVRENDTNMVKWNFLRVHCRRLGTGGIGAHFCREKQSNLQNNSPTK